MTNILDLSDAPTSDEERLLWLSGVKAKAMGELDDAFAETYARLRLQGRLSWAASLGIHSQTAILALTRRWNNNRGRVTRWGDSMSQ